MTERFRRLFADLPPPDQASADAVRTRAEQVLRPAGALRRLDDAAVHVAAWRETTRPTVEHPAILVFAGDHGVVAGGVSKYPADITAAMLAAVEAGRATINALGAQIGASVDVIDVGVGDPTGDIRTEPALAPERFDAIVDTAVRAVDRVADAGADLLVLGELGIGNTTAAAAICASVTGTDAHDWVGRGAGVDDDGLERKRIAVRTAAARVAALDDPITQLREVGGSELVAIAAACLQARHRRIPVVLDGFLAGAAVLPLHLADPGSLDHCIAGHRSAEPGHHRILERIGLDPLVDLDLRLGEGSGAAVAVPIVRLACAAVVDVATFDEWFGD